MTCDFCHRPIPRRDVAARRYTYSRFTGNHYCLRADCEAVHTRAKRKEAVA